MDEVHSETVRLLMKVNCQSLGHPDHYKPLTNGVRGLYCKVWAKFFPIEGEKKNEDP